MLHKHWGRQHQIIEQEETEETEKILRKYFFVNSVFSCSKNPSFDSCQPAESIVRREALVESSQGLYFTFFGRQSFFFLDETTPQSLQRKSPGLALRIGLPRWQDIVEIRNSRRAEFYSCTATETVSAT
jgi:hypothetical protein